jgi:F-type H+-transporting ATPase subunit a
MMQRGNYSSYGCTTPRAAVVLLVLLAGVHLCGGLAFAAEQDAGQVLVHHVSDNHVWKPVPFGPRLVLHDIDMGRIAIPVTQHVVMLWLVALGLAVMTIAAFGRPNPARPSRLATALEPLLLFVREGIVYPSMGKDLGERWLPFFYTLFLFLLASNMLGLVPLFPTITGNLAVTGALAAVIFVAVFAQGMLRHGVGGFFRNMVPDGIPWVIGIFLVGIEIGGLVIRNAVLAIRLFANMISGHFVIVALLMLMMLVHPAAGIVSVPLALFIDLLEVLVAAIQAMVFTMLAAIYIGMASAHH